MENQDQDMRKFWMTIGIVAVVMIVAVFLFRSAKVQDDPGLDPGRAAPSAIDSGAPRK